MKQVKVKVKDLEVEKIVFGQLQDSIYIKSQKHAFITYNDQKLAIQTPEFLTEGYGIPREGPFYATAKSRAFYKLPFCHERRQFPEELRYDAIEEMYQKFQGVDQLLDTTEFRLKLFGEKNADKYEYQPLVRSGKRDDDEEPGKYYRPPYTKVKLELAHDTEKPLFRLFDKTPTKRQEVVLSNFEEALDYMRYLTKHRMVIVFHKLYAMKTTAGNEKRKYGIILKAVAVECSNKSAPPGLSNNSIDMFIDDDEF
jgi:hypothetical protein